MERLALDYFDNPFSTDTGTPENNIPPIDEADEGEIVSTCHILHFYSRDSPSAGVRTISNITINSDSALAYNLVTSTIGYQHNAEKEEAIEGDIYN